MYLVIKSKLSHWTNCIENASLCIGAIPWGPLSHYSYEMITPSPLEQEYYIIYFGANILKPSVLNLIML